MEDNYDGAVAIKYIIALIINIGMSLIIAHYWGRKRQVGFGWSLFFLLFGNWIVGILVLLFSKKAGSSTSQSTGKVIIGYILFFIFGLMSLLHIILIVKGNFDFAIGFPLSICFTGAGIYLINVGKGVNYSDRLMWDAGSEKNIADSVMDALALIKKRPYEFIKTKDNQNTVTTRQGLQVPADNSNTASVFNSDDTKESLSELDKRFSDNKAILYKLFQDSILSEEEYGQKINTLKSEYELELDKNRILKKESALKEKKEKDIKNLNSALEAGLINDEEYADKIKIINKKMIAGQEDVQKYDDYEIDKLDIVLVILFLGMIGLGIWVNYNN